jgi:hypothetical protein
VTLDARTTEPTDAPTDERKRVAVWLLRLLLASRWAAPSKWRDVVVVKTPEREAVLPRLQFAEELRGAGLRAAAHEIALRRIGRGQVLTYVLEDDDERAGVQIAVFNLLGAELA